MKITAAFHPCLAVLAGLLFTVSVRAQSDDFADGNDTGWTHYAPLSQYGAVATYTVSNGTYRITSPPSPDEGQLGPARAGAVRMDVKYKNFYVSVDLKDWDPAEDTSMGILGRVQSEVGLQKTRGYAFTYQAKDTDVQISRVDQEVPTDLSGHPSVDLFPTGNYRMVFFGIGSHLEGRIYDMTNPLVPLITVTGTDSTYAEGSSGLVVFADENTRASAAFDNYFASNGQVNPPALKIPGEWAPVEISWPIAHSLCHTLERSKDLNTWEALMPDAVEGTNLWYSQQGDADETGPNFYRLRLGPPSAIGKE